MGKEPELPMLSKIKAGWRHYFALGSNNLLEL